MTCTGIIFCSQFTLHHLVTRSWAGIKYLSGAKLYCMRKPILAGLACCIAILLSFQFTPDFIATQTVPQKEDHSVIVLPITEEDLTKSLARKSDGIASAQEMEFEITRDVSLGYIPKNRLVEANQEILRKRRLNGTDRTNAFTWTERGPSSDVVGPSNGNGRVNANEVTSGRLRAIWFDLSDGTNQTVWIGGIDGGVWRTNNIGTDPATWTLSTDMTANIAISSICQSPANHNIMYFGTGEKTLNIDAVRGGGVWKSTDHGVTWSLLPSTTDFWNVSNVVCDPTNPNIVYVSTIGNGAGIRRSLDGGTSWTNITPNGLSDRITRMEISSTGRMHIVCGYRLGTTGGPDPASGYRYTDVPATVTSPTWSVPATSFYTSSEYNADIAVAGNTLYALPSNAAFHTPQVWKSTDGGVNWAITTTTPPITGLTPVSSGQAWYNLAIGVDPTDPNNVMVGGLNSYRSTNGGTTWTANSVWVTGVPGSSNYIHADHHILVWNNNQVLDGGDGGLFYSANDGQTWQDRNVGLRLKQFYAVAVHPSSTNYFIGGTQDNGCHQLNGAGLTTSVEITGGDGGFTHIDQDEPQFQYGSYTFSNYRVSTDGGNNWVEMNFGNTGQFINPTDYDDITNRLYGSWTAGRYMIWDNPQTGGSGRQFIVPALNNATVRHVKISPHTVNRLFLGTGGTNGGRVVRVDNALSAAPVATNITGAGMPASPNTVSCVAVGTSDNNLLATFSNYGLPTNRLWVTTNGGTSWVNITGDFPDIPVRWAMFHPDDNTKAILATDLGIYETALIDGANTEWIQDPNFPTVRVDMLQYRQSDGLLVAATHGRGIWTAPIPFTNPYVRFAFNYNYRTEGTAVTTGCRNYTDYTINMLIDLPPSGNANVTLTPSGTAQQGVDYDFTTNGNFTTPSNLVTFPNGDATPVPVTIRIYNDAELESAEAFTLTASIGGGTNASIAPGSPAYTFDIVENDLAPVSATNAIATAAGTSRIEQLGNNGTYYFYSGTQILAHLANAGAPLGCVTTSIFEAGTVWQPFTGGIRSQKVYDITPSTNSTTSYTVSLYYTLAELNGVAPANVRIVKTNAATMAAANETNSLYAPTTFAAYGTGFIFNASFTGFSKFFLVNNLVTLPVGLLNFDGIQSGDKILLNWSTSSEEGSSHFEIQKSYNGIQFQPIGKVDAAGSSNTQRNYNFIDKQLSEQNYYRLKMVDTDGSFIYSKTILIRISGIQQDVKVVNNPFSDFIDLRFAKIPDGPVQAQLVSSGGSVIHSKQLAPGWQVRFDFPGISVAKGTYILRITTGGKQFVSKVVKL